MKLFSLVSTALAGGALVCAAGSAVAQPASDTVDWSGPYVGANVGWNSANTRAHPGQATTNQLSGVSAGAGPVTVPQVTFPTRGMDYSDQSWTAGGQVGFNHQMGHLVLGLEGDMDAIGGRSRQASGYALPATALTTGSAVTIDRYTDPNWSASVRGRAGYAMGPALLYATGGLALADVAQRALYTYSPTVTPAVAAANPGATFGPYGNGAGSDMVQAGWVVGGGAEYKVTPAVSVGAEYTHSDYGTSRYGFGSGAMGATQETPDIAFTDDRVVAKVNFHFGAGMGIFH